MLIEQIDVVGTKPAETALDRFANVFGPAVHADDSVAVEARSKFGCDYYFVAPAAECPTEQLLVGEGPIALGRIEKGASDFDCAMERCDRLVFVSRTVALTHAHASEAEC